MVVEVEVGSVVVEEEREDEGEIIAKASVVWGLLLMPKRMPMMAVCVNRPILILQILLQ